jgi:mRNA interferase MazF
VWLVNFDPAVGGEIQKLRPALIVSLDAVGRLPLRLVVPLMDWKPQYHSYPWFVPTPADAQNGLNKHSGADAFQIKSVSVRRLNRRLGHILPAQLEEVATAVALCVGAP